MAQTSEATPPKLGVLLEEHEEAVQLSRQLIRLSIGARIAKREKDALAAERAAEDSIAKVVQLEEQLKTLL
jgi:predicted translin family RNA/ssDNA-binding protein